MSSIHFKISEITVLSCQGKVQEFVTIECSSHFQATSKQSQAFKAKIQASIHSLLSGITKKFSHSFLFIHGKTSFIIFSVGSV